MKLPSTTVRTNILTATCLTVLYDRWEFIFCSTKKQWMLSIKWNLLKIEIRLRQKWKRLSKHSEVNFYPSHDSMCPRYTCVMACICVVCGKHHENVSEFNRWHKNSVSWPCLLGFFFHLCLWFLSNRIRPSSNGSLAWYFFRLYCECRSSAIWKLHDEHKTF